MHVFDRTRRAAFITPLLAALALVPALLPSVSHAWPSATPGSGTVASENRPVGEFQAVAVSGSMDVVVRQGTTQSVQVQADDNLLPLLETVVEGGRNGATLQVRWKRGVNVHTRSKVAVQITVAKLSALAVAGSGNLRLETFSTPALDLTLSGSGDAKLEGLSTEDLGVRISGSGDVTGRGNAAKLKVSIAGSGDVSLADLRADDVTVTIAGSGDAAVNAQKSLSVSIAGSGDVTYTGNAQVKSSVAGSGSVTKR